MGKSLGTTALTYLWEKIKNLLSTGTAGRAQSIPFGKVDSTSTSHAFTATVEGITELRDGICCYLKNDVVTSAAKSTAPKCWTLNINGLGAKPVYVTNAAATYSTTHFTKDYKFLFTYDESLNSGNGGWYIGVLYNTNSTYSGMTVAEITAGTSTTNRLISPKNLRNNFYTEDEVDTLLGSKANSNDLATVATSGSYNDLSNKPTIPTVDSELDSESTNPVENQAIFHALKKLGIVNNGHEYVDLGLPSGTLWSTMYVGATSETTGGEYFRWGETDEVENGWTGDSYKYWSAESNSYTKYNEEDGLTVLQKEDDAASVHWGGDWRTPTSEDLEELFSNCTVSTASGGGYTVTGPNGNSIFLADNHWITTSGSTDLNTIMLSNITPNYCYLSGNGQQHYTGKFNVRTNAVNVRPILKEGYVDKYVSKDDSPYEVTYAELKQLKDNEQLIPGKYYRITDFVTTTKSEGVCDTNGMVASACHPFDIIVRADSSNVLNENAHAAVHEGDTYFANSNLSAWKLKYKLDLDSSYLWALDSSRTFNVLLVTHSNRNYLYVTIPDASDFHRHGVSNSILTDTSIDNISKLGMIDNNFYYRNSRDESIISNTGSFAVGDIVTDNHNDSYEIIDIGSITYEYRGIITYMKDEWDNEADYDFKNILFLCQEKNHPILDSDYFYYTFDSIEEDYSVVGEGFVYNNKLTGSVTCLPFNIFYKSTNTIVGISGNQIGSDSYFNVFENNADHNKICSACERCYFRANSRRPNKWNTIDTNTMDIYLIEARNSYIGKDCSDLSFSMANGITVMSGCNNITFGTSTGLKNYYKNIIIESGNEYIYLNNTQTTSSTKYCQNIKICQGVNNSTTWKQIDVGVVNNQYQIEYKSENSKTITV